MIPPMHRTPSLTNYFAFPLILLKSEKGKSFKILTHKFYMFLLFTLKNIFILFTLEY